MYSDIMTRTQIYLDPEDLKLLDRAAAETGASRSELIRRAVRNSFGSAGSSESLEILRDTAGSWPGDDDGAAFVQELRSGGLNERLARYGIGAQPQ